MQYNTTNGCISDSGTSGTKCCPTQRCNGVGGSLPLEQLKPAPSGRVENLHALPTSIRTIVSLRLRRLRLSRSPRRIVAVASPEIRRCQDPPPLAGFTCSADALATIMIPVAAPRFPRLLYCRAHRPRAPCCCCFFLSRYPLAAKGELWCGTAALACDATATTMERLPSLSQRPPSTPPRPLHIYPHSQTIASAYARMSLCASGSLPPPVEIGSRKRRLEIAGNVPRYALFFALATSWIV